jgi:hypothetical protein
MYTGTVASKEVGTYDINYVHTIGNLLKN